MPNLNSWCYYRAKLLMGTSGPNPTSYYRVKSFISCFISSQEMSSGRHIILSCSWYVLLQKRSGLNCDAFSGAAHILHTAFVSSRNTASTTAQICHKVPSHSGLHQNWHMSSDIDVKGIFQSIENLARVQRPFSYNVSLLVLGREACNDVSWPTVLDPEDFTDVANVWILWRPC